MFDPSVSGIMGGGWSGIPGVVTTAQGTGAGGFGMGASFGAGTTAGDGGTTGGAGAAGAHPGLGASVGALGYAVTHPTMRQALFFGAILLLAYAWRGHLKSMLE